MIKRKVSYDTHKKSHLALANGWHTYFWHKPLLFSKQMQIKAIHQNFKE